MNIIFVHAFEDNLVSRFRRVIGDGKKFKTIKCPVSRVTGEVPPSIRKGNAILPIMLPELNALNSAKYLYLRELSEPRDNSLRLVVQEAIANPDGLVHPHPELPELEEILRGSSLIESTDACRVFELTWERYVAYLVTEECVGSCGQDDDEVYTGQLFRMYTKSHFLEHLSRDTGGHTESVLHFKLTCLNHLVDVAAYAPPEVKQIGQVSSVPTRIQ